MRIIAFMNQKGGVGKTTTAVNLAASLAEQGQKVCMIDMDPQAHLTINYGVDPSSDMPSLYHVLVENHGFLATLREVGNHLALIPGSIDLAAAEVELVNVPGREVLLKNKIEAAKTEFDFMILDCPPSLGLLTVNALAVAAEVIIPMQPHFLALQGVGKLLETVALVSRQINPSLKVSGIVLTMFDSQTKLSNEVVNDLKGFIDEAAGKNLPWSNTKIFTSRIRRNIKLAESPSFGQTILQYDAASHGAADYRALAREVMEMTQPAVSITINPALKTSAAPKPAVKPQMKPEMKPEVKPPVAAPVIAAPAITKPAAPKSPPAVAKPPTATTRPAPPAPAPPAPIAPPPVAAPSVTVSTAKSVAVKPPPPKVPAPKAMVG